MSMNRVGGDRQRNGGTGQSSATLPAGTESNGRSTRSKESGEQLLPGIPNEITLDLITPKLSWRDFPLLSSISRTWQRAVKGHLVYEARVRSNSTETFALVNHVRPHTPSYQHSVWLYSIRGTRSFELPPIPHLCSGLPYSCQCVSLDGRVYILGGLQEPPRNIGSLGGGQRMLGSVEVYVLDLGGGQTQWKRCASMHEPRLGFGCGVLDGKIYVFGGESLDQDASGSEVYDPEVDAWFPMKPIPTRRFRHHVETVGKELVVHGGEFSFHLRPDQGIGRSTQSNLHLEIYNPIMDNWRVIKPFKRSLTEGVFVAKGKLHLMSQLGIYVYETDENSRTLLHSCSFTRIAPDHYAKILPLAAIEVDGELLVRVYRRNADVHVVDSFLLQSRGFGSGNKDVIWEEAKCSLSFEARSSPRNSFLTPVQL